MMPVAVLLCLPCFAAFVVFLCYATARPKATVAFFVLLMTSAAALATVGVTMLTDRQTAWQGVALM